MPQHHLILGGQRSGKSRHAERLGMRWLHEGKNDDESGAPPRRVTVVATAMASDDEMRQRIERHRLDRPAGFDTCEAPIHLGEALRVLSAPGRLLIIDCLTLWLTNVLMPAHVALAGEGGSDGEPVDWHACRTDLLDALRTVSSPVLLVSNEIGLGVIPMGAEVRHFVDELGRLNQDVAQCCGHVSLMAAGQPFTKAVERWA